MVDEDDGLLNEERVPEHLFDVVVALAHEGVPVRAIARATNVPSSGVYSAIQDGLALGKIAFMPKPDWPSNGSREERAPSFVSQNRVDDENLIYSCVRLFKVTRLQASLLAVLLLRNEVSKDTMHQIIESRRPPQKEETDPKMVDVVICNLRKRLRPHSISIKTLWACGYFMEPAQRKHVLGMINTYLDGGENAKEEGAGDEPGSGGGGYSADSEAEAA